MSVRWVEERDATTKVLLAIAECHESTTEFRFLEHNIHSSMLIAFLWGWVNMKFDSTIMVANQVAVKIEALRQR